MKRFWEEREQGALKPVLPSRQKHHWQTLECNYFATLEPIRITKSVQLLTGSPFPTYTPYLVTDRCAYVPGTAGAHLENTPLSHYLCLRSEEAKDEVGPLMSHISAGCNDFQEIWGTTTFFFKTLLCSIFFPFGSYVWQARLKNNNVYKTNISDQKVMEDQKCLRRLTFTPQADPPHRDLSYNKTSRKHKSQQRREPCPESQCQQIPKHSFQEHQQAYKTNRKLSQQKPSTENIYKDFRKTSKEGEKSRKWCKTKWNQRNIDL